MKTQKQNIFFSSTSKTYFFVGTKEQNYKNLTN